MILSIRKRILGLCEMFAALNCARDCSGKPGICVGASEASVDGMRTCNEKPDLNDRMEPDEIGQNERVKDAPIIYTHE